MNTKLANLVYTEPVNGSLGVENPLLQLKMVQTKRVGLGNMSCRTLFRCTISMRLVWAEESLLCGVWIGAMSYETAIVIPALIAPSLTPVID